MNRLHVIVLIACVSLISTQNCYNIFNPESPQNITFCDPVEGPHFGSRPDPHWNLVINSNLTWVKLTGIKGYGVKLLYQIPKLKGSPEAKICNYASNPTTYDIGDNCLYIDVYNGEYNISYPNNNNPRWSNYPRAYFEKNMLLFDFMNSSVAFLRFRITPKINITYPNEFNSTNITISSLVLTKSLINEGRVVSNSIIEPQSIYYFDYKHYVDNYNATAVFEMTSNCSEFIIYDGNCGSFGCGYPLNPSRFATTNITGSFYYFVSHASISKNSPRSITGVFNNNTQNCQVRVYGYDAPLNFIALGKSLTMNIFEGYTFFEFNYTSLKNFSIIASSDAGKSNAKIGIYYSEIPSPDNQIIVKPTSYNVQNNIGDKISLSIKLVNNPFAHLAFFSIYTLGEKATVTVQLTDGGGVPNDGFNMLYVYIAIGGGVVIIALIFICAILNRPAKYATIN